MNYSFEWSRLNKEVQQVILKNQKEFPIRIGNIAAELGLTVKSSTLNTGISGEISLSEQGYLIKVNRHDVKERQRFTVAHEIAHFLLHEHLIGDGITDDLMYRSNLSDNLEAEANRLAADIIMPWSLLKPLYNSMVELKIEQRIEKIATIAEVSVTAVKIRMGKL